MAKDSDDRDHDQQFDQGETLCLLHGDFLEECDGSFGMRSPRAVWQLIKSPSVAPVHVHHWQVHAPCQRHRLWQTLLRIDGFAFIRAAMYASLAAAGAANR